MPFTAPSRGSGLSLNPYPSKSSANTRWASPHAGVFFRQWSAFPPKPWMSTSTGRPSPSPAPWYRTRCPRHVQYRSSSPYRAPTADPGAASAAVSAALARHRRLLLLPKRLRGPRRIPGDGDGDGMAEGGGEIVESAEVAAPPRPGPPARPGMDGGVAILTPQPKAVSGPPIWSGWRWRG